MTDLMTCPECSMTMAPGSHTHCPGCGAVMDPDAAPPPVDPGISTVPKTYERFNVMTGEMETVEV